MSWTARSLTVQLRGDIHCGDLPLGFVARTHAFVPGHLPFFALVPVAVEMLTLPDRHASYVAVENLFTSCLRCTPFYIRDGESSLFPWKKDDREILEFRYLDSRYGVALEEPTRSAKEGCLYETEVILAQGRGRTQPTRLEGTVFYRQGSVGSLRMEADGSVCREKTRIPLADMLQRMRLGGDRTRGLGQPCLVSLADGATSLWGIYTVDTTGAWPSLTVDKGTEGPVPLAMDKAHGIQGRPLVLTGRRHTEQGPGMGMEKATAAYAPGWECPDTVTHVCLSDVRCATMAVCA